MANCRFGMHPPKVDYRTLRFQSYLKAGIAAPPASYNVLDTVYKNLKSSDSAKLFPMDGNDTIGDCTICGAGARDHRVSRAAEEKEDHGADGGAEVVLPPDGRTGHRPERDGCAELLAR